MEKTLTGDIKYKEDLIYLLGDTFDELSGSEYYTMISDTQGGKPIIGNRVPQVDALKNLRLYKEFYSAVQKELISSAISVGCGGIAVALAKKAMAGKMGVEISLKGITDNLRNDATLFSESQGRIVVSINPKNKLKFEKLFVHIPHFLIGKAREDNKFLIKSYEGKEIVNTDTDILLKSYRSTFSNF